MSTPILTTKLYAPRLRADGVRRPRLLNRLDAGLQRKLTLISAPAGFGKTTLLSQWIAASDLPVAWLALDDGDRDPTRFLAYLVAALQTIAPHIGESAAAALQSPQPPHLESVLTLLLNDIAAMPRDFILALDDYHAAEARAVDDAVAFLLSHLPPQMHLVIATRQDPNLPLARLRARGQLNELRAADLRFTAEEAADFLNQAMGLALSAEDVAALESRTEGWIAGLHLAALTMQGQGDASGFVRAFTGSHRFVLDYLVEEVLHQQPQPMQTFLLRTSILERLCGPLCDALVGGASGQMNLEAIETANLFIVPLDAERRWYRYHHLFGDLLRQRLPQHLAGSAGEDAVTVAELHRRASIWFEQNDLALEAFRHAVAANDVERAERLIQGQGMPLHFRGALTPVLNWLDSLPATILSARPALLVTLASASMMVGRPPEQVEEMMRAAELLLHDAEPDPVTQDLVGQIATIRAMLAIPKNEVEVILDQSRLALEYLHPDNLAVRTSAHWALGFVQQVRGERTAAASAFADAIAASRASGNTMITLGALTSLGQVQEAQNQLHLAAQTYRAALALFGEVPPPFTCETWIGLARILYEWNDLATAAAYTERSARLAQQLTNVDTPISCDLLMARLRLAAGDGAGAVTALNQAEQFARERGFDHRLPEIGAARVRVLLRGQDESRTALAAQLTQAFPIPASQARLHLAQNNPAAALAVLEPAQAAAEARDWADDLLQVAALRAIAHYAQDETGRAVELLAAALTLAEPGGFIRFFVDEGAAMASLLAEAAARGVMPDYVSRLRAAFDGGEPDRGDGAAYLAADDQALIEPLSPRELEVLGLVAQGLSNHEIGERLFLALDTVKGHNRRIFGKLGVRRRTEAVARAKELGLL